MLGAWLALTSWWTGLMIFGQDSGSGNGLPVDITAYGVAGTTVAILLYGIKTLWSDNKALRQEYLTMQNTSLERITSVAVTANAQLGESAKAMESATVMMHQLSGRPTLSPEQLYEISSLLRDLKGK